MGTPVDVEQTASAVVKELVDDAKAVGPPLMQNLVFLPLVAIGYLLFCIGIAVLLRPIFGLAGGFLVMSGANLFFGFLGIWLAPNRLPDVEAKLRSRLRGYAPG